MRSYYLYWYHLKTHNNPFSDGYIGVTCNLKVRHRAHLAGYKGGSRVLHQAFTKYGEDRILRSILRVTSRENAYQLERKYRPTEEIGWNIAAGGGLPPDTTGRADPPSVRAKRAASVKAARAGKHYPSKYKGMTNRFTEDQKALIGSYHKGKAISQSHRLAISEKMTGDDSPKAKPIHLVNINMPDRVYSFNCVRVAADTLGLNYNTLRSQFQYSCNKKESSDASRSGWICLQGKDITHPKEAVKRALTARSLRSKNISRPTGAENHKSKSVALENHSGEVLLFESISLAASHIGISEATIRYHIGRSLKFKTDSSFNKKGWKVRYSGNSNASNG